MGFLPPLSSWVLPGAQGLRFPTSADLFRNQLLPLVSFDATLASYSSVRRLRTDVSGRPGPIFQKHLAPLPGPSAFPDP